MCRVYAFESRIVMFSGDKPTIPESGKEKEKLLKHHGNGIKVTVLVEE